MVRALVIACMGFGWEALLPGGMPTSPLWVIVNETNEVQTVDRVSLRAIFTSDRRFWPGNLRVVAWNQPPRSAGRVQFDRAILAMEPDEAGRFWIDRQVRGGAPPPRKVPSTRLAVAMVRRLKGGIAYVSASDCVPRGLRLLAVIDDGKMRAPTQEEMVLCDK